MKRRCSLALLIVGCLMLLSACKSSEPEQYQVVTSVDQLRTQSISSQAVITQEPTISYDFDSGDYDPASEENIDAEEETIIASLDVTVPPQTMSHYAGATPVLLDPIDKPTPTPAPALTISSFTTYDATKLRLSFEGPVGWEVNDLAADTFTLINPDNSVDYQATLTVRCVAVASAYGESDMKKEVKTLLSNVKSEYNNWSPTNTASRTLMDKKGVYADFTGTRKDTGASVWGRIHITCVNKNLIVMQLTCPRVYSQTYKDTVYSKFRHSVKFTR